VNESYEHAKRPHMCRFSKLEWLVIVVYNCTYE